MTHEEIEKIGIGAPFMWSLDGQASTRADDLTNAFHVSGLEADLTRTGPHDEWQYRLHQKGNTVVSPSYETKEQALEGLKSHLQSA